MHCWTITCTCNHHGRRVGKVKLKSKDKEDQERSSLKPSTLAITAAIYWLYPSSHRKFRKFRLEMERTSSVRSDWNIWEHLWRWSTLTGPVISVGPTELSLSILTKLFSLVQLFCILLTRTKPYARWLGSGLCKRNVPLHWALTEFLLNGKHPKCRILIAH